MSGLIALAVLVLLLASCGESNVSTDAGEPSDSSTSSAQASTEPNDMTLEVKETGFREVTVEYWEDGASVLDTGYIWGALVENTSDQTAVDVTVEVAFETDDGAETVDFTVDEIPPGEFAWGSRPVPVATPSGDPAEVNAIAVTMTAAGFRPAGEVDQLISPEVVSADQWTGEITVEALDDPRPLYSVVAYFDGAGQLIAVEPAQVDPSVLQPGEPAEVFVPAVPEGGEPDLSEVRVFLARLADPGEFVRSPATFPPAG